MKPLTVSNDYHPEALRRFNSDVDKHEMTVLLDQGLYRHLRFKEQGTGMYYFDIITSPGLLTIRGDMGTYIFSREPDMFPWFNGGHVNAGYWGEKLQAIDKQGGYKEHAEDLFKQFIVQDFWERRVDYSEAESAAIWAEIRETMLGRWVDTSSASACWELMDGFKSHEFTYTDAWENTFKRFTFHYLWCCHAILAGIRHYNDARQVEAA